MTICSRRPCVARLATQGTSRPEPKGSKMRNTYSTTRACTFAGRTALIVGVAALTVVYGFALFIRGPDVGANNGCTSTYSDAPARQSLRDEYQRILDKADPTSTVDWTSTWSYFPPGWVCSARGLVGGEGQTLGVIRPPTWGAAVVLTGAGATIGGALTLAGTHLARSRNIARNAPL